MTVTRLVLMGLLAIAVLAGATSVAGCSSPTEAPNDGVQGDVPASGGPAGSDESDIGPVDAPREPAPGYPALPTNAAPPADSYAGPGESSSDDGEDADDEAADDEGGNAEGQDEEQGEEQAEEGSGDDG